MELPEIMATAARSTLDVARNVKADQLGLPTPCSDWDVRTLVNHLMFWSAFRSEVAAHKQNPPSEQEGEVDYVIDGWLATFERQLDLAVAAWAQPGALQGETGLAGGSSPAPLIATMIVGELVVHGWDLARATGQELAVAPEVTEVTHAGVAGFAEQAWEYHIFGDPVPVPDDAPLLTRTLALTGRDPEWSP